MSDLRSKAASLMAGRQGAAHPQREDSAGTRFSDQQVEFRHEFALGSAGDVHPPGRYVIEVSEDDYSGSGHTAHVRKSTSLIVRTPSGTRAIPIDVRDLEAALTRDAERQQLSADGENPRQGEDQKPSVKSSDALLEQYGIERVTADVFIWGRYRYTNASDAIAAAKRAERQ